MIEDIFGIGKIRHFEKHKYLLKDNKNNKCLEKNTILILGLPTYYILLMLFIILPTP